MRNKLNHKNLNERPAARAMVALTLTASLAAFGCTTNRTPGNGEPYRSGPGVGPTAAPTSGVNGTSSGSTVPDQPMMSSSTHTEALPTVNARAKRLPLSPDEAAAVMAGQTTLNRGVKVLGPVNPAAGTRGLSEGVVTGAFRDPALVAAATINPGVNNTVRNVSGGAAGPIVSSTDVSGVAVTNGAVLGASVVAPTTSANGTALATPTNAALPVTPGAFAAGTVTTTPPSTTPVTGASMTNTTTLSPTTNSAVVPAPTATSRTVVSPVTASSGRTVITNTNGRVSASRTRQ